MTSFKADCVVRIEELTDFSALSSPVVSPPISIVMPLILLAMCPSPPENGQKNSPDCSGREKSTNRHRLMLFEYFYSLLCGYVNLHITELLFIIVAENVWHDNLKVLSLLYNRENQNSGS